VKTAYQPLPIHQEDRLHVANVAGFHIVEAMHPPQLVLTPHAHEQANLTVLMEGVFRESYAHETAECAESSVLFRPAGEKHSDHIGRSGAHNLSIEVSELRLELIHQYTKAGNTIWHFRDAQVDTIARRICRELRSKDDAVSLALEGLVLESLAFSVRRWGSAAERHSIPRWLLTVRDLLHDRFAESLQFSELAESAGVHPVYLARAFRAHFNCTPGEYLRRLRIEWAMRQLVMPNTTIVEIAQQAGFTDQSHFSRVFKQQTGFTPGQFRRELGSQG
jgi:AraC family transcriptional regulator